MPKLKFSIAEIKCAFWEWMPKQSVLAIDFGDTEESREETIRYLWQHFFRILSRVERSP